MAASIPPSSGPEGTKPKPQAPSPRQAPSLQQGPDGGNGKAENVHEDILGRFKGPLPPLRVPFHYRLGLFLIAVAMVLLPLVYIGLIVLTALALHYHATHSYVIFEGAKGGRSGLGALLVYLGPLVAGGILVFFMIKPLFARRPKRTEPRRLKRDREQLLFAFVEKVCQAVGAPAPAEIHANSEVNASASFRRGLWSLFGGDLVLTVGLPMAGGLSVQQFAGVLAHEFGHFAQRAGMRTTYLINWVNAWFQRVVYERDEWDENLVRWSKELDIRIGGVFYLARFFVWLTRRILWVLMVVAHAISCFMSREMEYDADRHEAWLAGSRDFEATYRRITELSCAHQVAQRDLGSFWDEGRLPDDLTGLIVSRTEGMPGEVKKAMEKDLRETATGWFDTHPAGRDRIARARAENAPGVLECPRSAAVLFRDFPGLCKESAKDVYREVLGPKFSAENLRPLAELLQRQEREKAGGEALQRYFQGRLSPLRPLPVGQAAEAPASEDALRAARERMLQAVPAYSAAFKRYDEADTRILETFQASALLRAGFKPKPADFKLLLNTADAAIKAREKHAAEQTGLVPELEQFESVAAARLLTAVRLLESPDAAAKVPEGAALRDEAAALVPATVRIGGFLPALLELRNTSAALMSLLGQIKGNEENQALIGAVRGQLAKLHKELSSLRQKLGDTPYPFDRVGGPITLTKYAVAHVPGSDQLGDLLEASRHAMDQLYSLYFRCLARLAFIAEQVEAAAGLPPLPEPPKEKE